MPIGDCLPLGAATWSTYLPTTTTAPSGDDLSWLSTHRHSGLSTPTKRDWYRFQAAATADAPDEVWIYDEIAWYALNAQQFAKDLRGLKSGALTVHVNSPGGNVFDGIAIYNLLRAHPADVTVRIEGIAASIASVIAMAGDRVVMAPHAMLMIHDPWSVVMGNAETLLKEAEVLDKLGSEIAQAYAERAGGIERAWRDLMLAETWYTDQEAVDAGLADEIDAAAATAENHFDLSRYGYHPPAELQLAPTDASPRTERDAERALRDAGFSRNRAKAILARGWDDEPEAEREAPSVAPATEAATVVPLATRKRQLQLLRSA